MKDKYYAGCVDSGRIPIKLERKSSITTVAWFEASCFSQASAFVEMMNSRERILEMCAEKDQPEKEAKEASSGMGSQAMVIESKLEAKAREFRELTKELSAAQVDKQHLHYETCRLVDKITSLNDRICIVRSELMSLAASGD